MKKCRVCSAELIKRAHESNKRFSKKQFCSSKCSRVYMKKNKMGWWSKENKSDFIFPEETGEI
jgi:hypothetical protein